MRRALLDVNVLVALLDTDHVGHRRARGWLEEKIEAGWAPCAITQNGLVRVMSQPRHPSPIPVAVAADLLARACATPWHEFWSSDVSLLDPIFIDRYRIHEPRQVTDAYLLALASAHAGRLVTLDRTIPCRRYASQRRTTSRFSRPGSVDPGLENPGRAGA